MTVTYASHPTLYNAFTLILLDCGAINRTSPQPTVHHVPPGAEDLVEPAERGLRTLTDEDEFGDFVYGEHDVAHRISRRSPDLTAAHTLLNLFFDYDPTPEAADDRLNPS